MSTSGYGVFVNESLPMTFFVGSRYYPKHEIAIEGDLIDQFFFYGPSMKRIQMDYTRITGKAPMVPKWSLGTWMSRISYNNQAQVEEVAKRMREEKWPCDVINIDVGWFEEDWRCDWKFSPKRFPDPKGMLKKLDDMNFKVCLWQWPYLVDQMDVTEEAKKREAMAKGQCVIVNLPLNHIDFTCDEGVAFYQDLLRPLLEMGVAAIKTDFGEHVADHMQFKNMESRKVKNLYALLYQKAANEICNQYDALLWARSAYAGSQRYPVHWAGDSCSSFGHLYHSLCSGISLGMSGFTFWSNDTGGFFGTPSDELYIRWVGVNIFNSHMRFHGNGPKFREPWNYEPKTQKIVKKLLNLRYQLIPYLYSECVKSTKQGLPVLRHLVYEFQEDPTCWNIDDQFMFGEAIMVAPILTEGKNTRNVWIPPGLWYEYDSDIMIEGPKWINVTADLSTVPFYYRGGYSVPLGPQIFHAEEVSDNPLIIKVFLDADKKSQMEMHTEDEIIKVTAETMDDAVNITVSETDIDYSVVVIGLDTEKVVVKN